MNDQSKSQAQKSQPTDLISSIKNKTELKESEKQDALDYGWNDYSDNEEDDMPTQSQAAVKEKENKDKNEPKKLGDILSKKQTLPQQQKKTYNNNNNYNKGGERKHRDGGMKKFYNSNAETGKNFSNQNPNYVRKERETDKNDMEKRIGNFKNLIADNQKVNENFRPTKTYDIEPSTQSKDQDLVKPNFKNEGLRDNMRELNADEDLYLKNLKERGLDREPERKEGEQEDENRDKKRPFNNNRRPYNNNNKNYQNRQRNYNTNGPRPEKELDEDGFEKVVVNKTKRSNNQYNNYNRNRVDNRQRNDVEQKIWDSVIEQVPREGEEGEENKEEFEGDRQRRDENPRDQRDKKDKRGQKKDSNVWEIQPDTKEKVKEVEVKPQQTKVEFTMKASNLKDIFSKKK